MECVYYQNDKCLKQMPGCDSCPSRLDYQPGFLGKWQDPLVIISRQRVPSSDQLRNLLAGASVFLVGGGPSANQLPLEQLGRKGVWSMCVNNVAGHDRFRTNAFVCSDPPSKFSHCIWLDPQIMKFIPTAKLGGRRCRLRRKLADGTFEQLKDHNTSNSPNVWGFQRWSWMYPDDRFFLTDGACWGNHQSGVEKTGQPKTVCTMLLGIRLLRFLGAKRIYLVGVDFHMRPDWGYSFSQNRDPNACSSNNNQFSVVNQWLCEMQQNGIFEKFGLELYNCYQNSGLRAFPYVPFDRAIIDCAGMVDAVPDLSGWYEK